MKASYPVILTPAGRGYVVFVPNLNINTEGGTLAEALDMARDAISIWGITEQDAGRTIPEASDTMPTAVGGQIVRRVEVDFEAYRRGATAYPACFYKENDGYSVIFPDLNYLATQGDNFGDSGAGNSGPLGQVCNAHILPGHFSDQFYTVDSHTIKLPFIFICFILT